MTKMKDTHDFMVAYSTEYAKKYMQLKRKDHDFIGKLLTYHLIVEHYLTKYIHTKYPDLSDKHLESLKNWTLFHESIIPEVSQLLNLAVCMGFLAT